MKIRAAEIFSLHLPFKVSFRHAGKVRRYSDSIVVKLTDTDGTVGFGEGVARPYVTGETVPMCLEYMQRVLWPSVQRTSYEDIPRGTEPLQSLRQIANSLPDQPAPEVIAWHGARTAFETALIDLCLKRQDLPLASLLIPKRDQFSYSGVIGLGSLCTTMAMAAYFRGLGLTDFKLKISQQQSISNRLYAVRTVIGKNCSLRLDANCAFPWSQAQHMLAEVERHDVVCVEQPIPRTDPIVLAKLQRACPVPLMADESLVTMDDALGLIDNGACGYFNLRLAKCGGIFNTLKIHDVAVAAGIRVQLGCQVGETAILSAAGRHVAAYLHQAQFVEGCYGSRLLSEDVATHPVGFSRGGSPPSLNTPGLGIEVNEAVLHKHSLQVLSLTGG